MWRSTDLQNLGWSPLSFTLSYISLKPITLTSCLMVCSLAISRK
ncbi:MAG: hypothetical protein ACTS4Y_00425 [Candidatus Hodgkinia cicadicola]